MEEFIKTKKWWRVSGLNPNAPNITDVKFRIDISPWLNNVIGQEKIQLNEEVTVTVEELSCHKDSGNYNFSLVRDPDVFWPSLSEVLHKLITIQRKLDVHKSRSK